MSLNSDDISPVLVSLKLNLVLCKFFGVCSLSNIFGNSHTSLLNSKFFSPGKIYHLLFILYYQFSYPQSIGILIYQQRKAHFVTLLSLFFLVMFLECMFSDRKLLKLLKSIDEADEFVKKAMPDKSKLLVNRDAYRWLFAIFLFDAFLFFERHCDWDIPHCLNTESVHAMIYHHIPYLSVISLFCALSNQLIIRFQLARTMFENRQRLDDPLFIEECRHLYNLIVVSAEIFLDWISVRLTNHFMLITFFTVCQICFPCFNGKACVLSVVTMRILQQMIMIYFMCYCASKLSEKSEEILNDLLMIPLGKSPYNCKDQIDVFIDQIIARPLKVSALGLFDVDMTTLPSVFSVMTMYTVVVAQLADRMETYFVLH